MSDPGVFNVVADLACRYDAVGDDLVDDIIDSLEGLGPAVARSALGWMEVTVTVTAVDLADAITTAAALVGRLPVAARALRVLPTADYDQLVDIDARLTGL